MTNSNYQWMKKLGSAPMFVSALLFAFGIYLEYKINVFPNATKIFTPLIPTFAIVSIIFIFIALSYILLKRINIIPLVCAVIVLFGFLSAQIVQDNMYEDVLIVSHSFISGKVNSVEANGVNSISLVLKDVVLEGDKAQAIKGRVNLIVYGESSDVLLKRFNIKNSFVKTKSSLMYPSGAAERGFYDERISLLSEKTTYKALAHYATVDVIKRGHISAVLRFFSKLKNNFNNNVKKHVGGREAGLLTAVLTGEKSGLDDKIKEDFAMLGTSHLLATSGLHIGVMLLVFVYLLKKTHTPIIFRTIICAVVILLFLTFAGFRVSMIRAAIMWSALMVSRIFGRKSSVLNSLGIAMIGMLIANPFILFSVSFILSCVSVASIGVFSDIFKKMERIKKGRFLLDGIIVSLSIVVFSWPVTAYYFNSVPILSPVFNLLFVPLVSLALIAGILFGVLSWIAFLAPVLGVLVKALYSLIIILSDYLADFSPQINILSPPIAVAFLWMLGIMVLMIFVNKKAKLAKALVPISMMAAAVIIMIMIQLQSGCEKTAKIYSDGSNCFLYITNEDKTIMIMNDDSFIASKVINKSNKNSLDTLIYSGNNIDSFYEILDNTKNIDIREIYLSDAVMKDYDGINENIEVMPSEVEISGYTVKMLEFKAKSATAKIHYAVMLQKNNERVLYLDPMSLRTGAFDDETFNTIVSSKWSAKRAEGIMNINLKNLIFTSHDAYSDEYILLLEQEGVKTYNVTEKAITIFSDGD